MVDMNLCDSMMNEPYYGMIGYRGEENCDVLIVRSLCQNNRTVRVYVLETDDQILSQVPPA